MSETKIIQCIIPNLLAGEYKIKVDQTIQAAENIQTINKDFTFGVDAARFTLNAQDIYAAYPPENTTGDYSNHLPHIVFNRRTLPWERTIDGKEPKFTREGKEPVDIPPCPWMTLLLFSDEEMKDIKIISTALEDVIIAGDKKDTITRPGIAKNGDKNKENTLRLMPWESATQKCMIIDITKDQFYRSVPDENDLPFLAHSKLVTIDHKDQNGIEDTVVETQEQKFEIEVYSSQEPSDTSKDATKGKEKIEVNKTKVTGDGYFSVLMGNRLITSKGTYTAVLVSLEGFGPYLTTSPSKDISTDKVRLVVLAHWTFTNHGNKTFKTLLDNVAVKSMAVETTSTPLRPYLNQGYVPMKHHMKNGAKNMSWYRGPFVPNELGFNTFLFESFTSADGALRYHQDTGLMDVSISAAWELGKLLALQNKEFTKAIVAWNTNPLHHPHRKKESYTKDDIVNWLEKGEKKENIHDSGFIFYKPYPGIVVDFLKEIASFKGVPISYLIPDIKCLKDDQHDNAVGALSMFYVDPLWIYALLEGAVSLRSSNHTQTRYNISNIIKEVYYFSEDEKAMGFLLRSPLVSGWRGIEIKVYNDTKSTEPLDFPIRFERILPDTFLGIFPTSITRIEVIQPYEGLHFGVKPEGDLAYSKLIKNNEGKTDANKKVQINQGNKLIAADHIKVNLLAQELKKLSAETPFTSAEFAFQMIDSPILATFNIKPQKL